MSKHRPLRTFSCGLMAALVTTVPAVDSWAGDGNPATSSVLQPSAAVLPYEGTLMLDGAPVTGSYTVRFRLYDHPSNASANDLRYEETQSVSFYGGRFSVAIGRGQSRGGRDGSVFTAVQDADLLYLAIEIQDTSGSFVPLSGRQVIEAYPYAMVSSNAPSMAVAGNLSSGGDLTVTGNATINGRVTTDSASINSLQVNSSLRVDATVLTNMIVPRYVNASNLPVAGGGAVIANDNGPFDALVIRGNGAKPNDSDFNILMLDNVRVGKNLTVGSRLQVNGPLRTASPPPMVCAPERALACQDVVGAPLEFLDRHHVRCNAGEFIQGWRLGYGCSGNQRRMYVTCCSFNWNAP